MSTGQLARMLVTCYHNSLCVLKLIVKVSTSIFVLQLIIQVSVSFFVLQLIVKLRIRYLFECFSLLLSFSQLINKITISSSLMKFSVFSQLARHLMMINATTVFQFQGQYNNLQHNTSAYLGLEQYESSEVLTMTQIELH